jgi:regulator of sigma E protease
VGFGKRLWGIRRGETDYRVSAVPLGGYVRLGGESPEDADPTDPREFLNKPRWQRVLVYLAGPAANIVLAVLVFAVLFMVGIEVMSFPDLPPVIGGVEAHSSAAQAGLQRGDRILTLKGKPIGSWQDVLLTVMGSPEQPVAVTFQRGKQVLHATVTPKLVPRYEVGDLAGMLPMIRPHVIKLEPGEPAEAAGFRPGDEIRAVDGRPLILSVVPRNDNGKGRVGVYIGFFQRFGPSRAFIEGARYSVQTVEQIFEILGKIFTRELSAKSALSGPIEIAKQSGEAARIGFKYLLQLMGFISISIAVMNLMPIPILDGGQIFILMVEGVIRRDLSLRLKEVISQVGFVMILLLMFVVIYFDVMKNLPAGLKPGG